MTIKDFQILTRPGEDGEPLRSWLQKRGWVEVLSGAPTGRSLSGEVVFLRPEFFAALGAETEAYLVIVCGPEDMPAAASAMHHGAHDLLAEPFGPEEVDVILARASRMRRLQAENHYLRSELKRRQGDDCLIGQTDAICRLREALPRLASTSENVLILGEPGTGRHLAARLLHAAGSGGDEPLVQLACRRASEEQLEVKLFGYRLGSRLASRTEKPRHRRGLLELAGGGTLLLEDVECLPTMAQARLARAAHTGTIAAADRPGSSGPIPLAARLVSITAQDPEGAGAWQGFDRDLLTELATVVLHLPALRERMDDLPALAEYFLGKFASEHHRPIRSLSPEARDGLREEPWPDNVSGLQRVMERTACFGVGEVTATEIQRHLGWHRGGTAAEVPERPSVSLGTSLDEVERSQIFRTLDTTSGNRSRAAQLLGISSRTLRNKLARYQSQGFPVPVAQGAKSKAQIAAPG